MPPKYEKAYFEEEVPDLTVPHVDQSAGVIGTESIYAYEGKDPLILYSETYEAGSVVKSAALETVITKTPEGLGREYKATITASMFDAGEIDVHQNLLNILIPGSGQRIFSVDGLQFSNTENRGVIEVSGNSGMRFIIYSDEKDGETALTISNNVQFDDDLHTHRIEANPPLLGYFDEDKLLTDFLKTFMHVMNATPYVFSGNMNIGASIYASSEPYLIKPRLPKQPDRRIGKSSFVEMMDIVYREGAYGLTTDESLSSFPGLSPETEEFMRQITGNYLIGCWSDTDETPPNSHLLMTGRDNSRKRELAQSLANSLDAALIPVEGKEIFSDTERSHRRKIDGLFQDVVSQDGRTVLFIEEVSRIFHSPRKPQPKNAAYFLTIAKEAMQGRNDVLVFAAESAKNTVPEVLLTHDLLSWVHNLPLPDKDQRMAIFTSAITEIAIRDAAGSNYRTVSLTSGLDTSALGVLSANLTATQIIEIVRSVEEDAINSRKNNRNIERFMTMSALSAAIRKING